MGRSSRAASSRASWSHVHQLTGLSACWRRYALEAFASRLVTVAAYRPRAVSGATHLGSLGCEQHVRRDERLLGDGTRVTGGGLHRLDRPTRHYGPRLRATNLTTGVGRVGVDETRCRTAVRTRWVGHYGVFCRCPCAESRRRSGSLSASPRDRSAPRPRHERTRPVAIRR